MTGLTYRESGVDIDAGDRLVQAIKPLARSTSRSGADAALGGFGGLFDLKAAGYIDPLLVSGNDGVGTKLLLAIESGIHDTVGVDCVAMCVNDVVVQGAEPLFFLDYIAVGKLEVEMAATVIGGIAEGCRQAGCALIGGESAELPASTATVTTIWRGSASARSTATPCSPLRTSAPATCCWGWLPAASIPTASPWYARPWRYAAPT